MTNVSTTVSLPLKTGSPTSNLAVTSTTVKHATISKNETEVTTSLETTAQETTTSFKTPTIPTTTSTTDRTTTTTTTTTTTDDISSAQKTTDAYNSAAPIAGGVIGGLIFIVLIMLILFIFIRKRRRRKRRSDEIPMPPGKEYIDGLHMTQARQHVQSSDEPQKHYMNVTSTGCVDDQTDPSIGPDGYLKKTSKHLFLFGKKQKKRKTRESNGSGIYDSTEGQYVGPQLSRSMSLPQEHAPPPPPENRESNTSSGYTEGRVANSNDVSLQLDKYGYIILPDKQKVAAVPSDKSHKTKKKKTGKKESKSKQYVSSVSNSPNQNPDEGTNEFEYQNVDGKTYYNTKDQKSQHSTDQSRRRMYENLENDQPEVQEVVYEDPGK